MRFVRTFRNFSTLFIVTVLAPLLLPLSSQAAPGDLYVSDSANGIIFKFTASGKKSTFASGLNVPAGLAFDRQANLVVAERFSGTIFKFTPEGTKSTFFSGLNLPFALAFDAIGNLFVTESTGDSGTISKISPAGVKSQFAGGNFLGLAFDTQGNLFATHGGPFDWPGGITKFTSDGAASDFAVGAGPELAFSASGDLFAGNKSGDSGILKFPSDGSSRTIFTSEVQSPYGLAFDNAGNLFVADSATGSILMFTADAKRSTFASGLQEPTYLAFEPVIEKLRNLSARGLVGTGDGALIAGFIVGGNALATNSVVVRAIGPSLAKSGVTNPLFDPVLELHNSSGAILATNGNWQETQKEQISATGLAPTDPNESAIFATLPAGNYTAVVRGNGETTGTALAEVYSVTE